ncbi:MAG TPA: response regulator [Puia sp.]|jgi:DNA-binding response OmpR family regulator|nr:response regulator [Puia sp.]
MKKILVIDDDVDILLLVKLALTMNGLDVRTLSRWEMIPETIEEYAPALILMDISLGTADGRDICKGLKREALTKDIPVILFSANNEFQKSIGECQAEGFIAKPFDISDLVARVKEKAR